MSFIEIIAALFSLLCIWLAVKRNAWNWPVGLVGVSAYLILFYQVRLYADMLLQIVFILQGLYGWYNWKFNTKEADEIQISTLNNNTRTLWTISIVLFSLIWAYLLKRYTNASTPYVDSLAASVSLAANWLMARKKLENWILWILVDIIYIALFWYKELYISSAVYFIFLLLAINGLVEWKKSYIEKGLH